MCTGKFYKTCSAFSLNLSVSSWEGNFSRVTSFPSPFESPDSEHQGGGPCPLPAETDARGRGSAPLCATSSGGPSQPLRTIRWDFQMSVAANWGYMSQHTGGTQGHQATGDPRQWCGRGECWNTFSKQHPLLELRPASFQVNKWPSHWSLVVYKS